MAKKSLAQYILGLREKSGLWKLCLFLFRAVADRAYTTLS